MYTYRVRIIVAFTEHKRRAFWQVKLGKPANFEEEGKKGGKMTKESMDAFDVLNEPSSLRHG